MDEEWVEIESWPKYKVSNYGNVLNVQTNRYVKSSYHKQGYLGVNLERDGKHAYVPLARLVALAFVDGYFDGAEVKHKDHDRKNLRADNLEWVTHWENNRWNAGRHGTSVRREVINPDTGEVLRTETNISQPRRIHYKDVVRTGVVNRETGEIEWNR